MKCYYDFHIHSCLSPCALEEMTPNNIVNMALLCGLNVIAVTDHNAAENIEAVLKVSKDKDILVIPGMEIETREEIHVVVLLPTLESLNSMNKIVVESLPKICNKSSVFGEQLILDENDDEKGINERLLLTATSLSIEDVFEATNRLEGVAIPAHIDRPSYSIISNLGWIPENLGVSTIEISKYGDLDKMKEKFNGYKVIQSSDAHELEHIFDKNNYIEVEEVKIQNIINYLKNQTFKTR